MDDELECGLEDLYPEYSHISPSTTGLKYRVGDTVSWKDGNRTMTGIVEQAYTHKKTPNIYYIRVGKNTFTRYEPDLITKGGKLC